MPHFYLTVRCNLDPLLKLPAEINPELGARGVELSVNDMLMKAMALVAVPDANPRPAVSITARSTARRRHGSWPSSGV